MNRWNALLEHFYLSTHIPVLILSVDGMEIMDTWGFLHSMNPYRTDAALLGWLRNHLPDQKKPWIHYEQEVVCYCLFRTRDHRIAVLGPVCVDAHDQQVHSTYARLHRLPEGFFLPVLDLLSFCAGISLLNGLLTDTFFSASQLTQHDLHSVPPVVSTNRALQKYVMEKTEEEIGQFAYAQELKKFQEVEAGNLQQIRDAIRPETLQLGMDLIGTMSKSAVKQWEYSIVCNITLATRAAIRGGVPPATAYALSDVMLQRLDSCTTFTEMYQLSAEVRMHFAACVQQYHKQNSHLSAVEKAKLFMQTHLNKRFTLEELANHVQLSKPHLCKRFKEAEGISPMEYIQHRRIDAAKDMLRFTDSTIAYIAEYLCYSSQSHFGRVFKAETGLTPKQYRDDGTENHPK